MVITITSKLPGLILTRTSISFSLNSTVKFVSKNEGWFIFWTYRKLVDILDLVTTLKQGTIKYMTISKPLWEISNSMFNI